MIIFKWLRRADRTSRFIQPDRRAARRFTPRADGLEDRISLSDITFNGPVTGGAGGAGPGGGTGGPGVVIVQPPVAPPSPQPQPCYY